MPENCLHLRIGYKPKTNLSGAKEPAWACLDCGKEFVPVVQINGCAEEEEVVNE